MIKSALLGNVCKVTTGQSAPQDSKVFTEEGVPFIRAGSLEGLLSGKRENQFELINESNAKKFRLKLFPKDTVIFAKSGMSAKIGRVYRLKVPCYLVSHLAAVSPSGSVDPGFLHRWFEWSPPSRLIENDAYPSIKTGVIQGIEIPLPPLAEQKRIAAIMDAADALRAKRRESLALLDTLLQSTFLDMFGDPVTNPKGWKVVDFKEVGTSRLGKMLDKGKEAGNCQFPYLANFNVQWGRFVLDDLRCMDFTEKDRKEFELKAGDLLVCEGGEVGRTAIWRGEIQDVYFQKALHRVRLDPSRSVPEYVQQYMWFMARNGGFKDFTNSATIAHLTGVKLKTLPFPLPPLDLQRRFASFVESIEQQKARLRQHLAQLDTLFASLQQRAFNGDL